MTDAHSTTGAITGIVSAGLVLGASVAVLDFVDRQSRRYTGKKRKSDLLFFDDPFSMKPRKSKKRRSNDIWDMDLF